MGKGNSSNFKTECGRGFPVPGVFKLDHLQLIKPLLLPNFHNFSTLILGEPILITPERIETKWKSRRNGTFTILSLKTFLRVECKQKTKEGN